MKKSAPKLLALALALIMTAASFTGCGGNSGSSGSTADGGSSTAENSAATEGTGERTEPVTISAMLFDRGNVPEGQGTITDNMWTKWINEQMAEKNITVEFVPVPRSEEVTKVNTMMASGTAADIMMSYYPDQIQQYYEDGGLYDVAPYIDGAPQLKEYLGESVLNASKLPSGEMFGVFARRSTTGNINCFIRTDWLEALDMEVPTTVDELYEVLTAFKQQDPGGVGSEKVVAMVAGNALKFAFLSETLDQESYNINSPYLEYADEGYREYMRFRNKCYNEGLMDPEYFTSKNFSQKEKELCVSGQLGYWEYDVNGNVDNLRGGLLQNLKQNIPTADFVAIDPMKNVNNGEIYTPNYSETGAVVFLPKTAKDPEACFEYLDFLAGEGGFTVFHGFEGEHFEFVDDVPVVIDAEKNATEKDWIRHDLFLVGNQGYYKTEEDFMAATSKELPGYEEYVIDNYTKAGIGIRMHAPIYTSPTQVEQTTNLTKVKEKYEVEVTTCSPDQFDAIYDQWMAEMEKYDVQKILDERAEYYAQ